LGKGEVMKILFKGKELEEFLKDIFTNSSKFEFHQGECSKFYYVNFINWGRRVLLIIYENKEFKVESLESFPKKRKYEKAMKWVINYQLKKEETRKMERDRLFYE
jgi:hypothetical protein